MALYRAAGNISHGSASKGDMYCPKGSVVELPEDEVKSDLFILIEPAAPVVAAAVEPPRPVAVESVIEAAPVVEEAPVIEEAPKRGRRRHVEE